MASYATPADMAARFSEQSLAQVSDPDGVSVQESPILAALADASAEVDAYLSRFILPLVQVPAVLRLHVCNMAMYHLLNLRPLGDIEDARKRYDDAKKFLAEVGRGAVDLGLSAAGQPAETTHEPTGFGNERIFTMDRLSRWP